jgi:hypothetical protein
MDMKCASVSVRTGDNQTAPVTFLDGSDNCKWTQWFTDSRADTGTCADGNFVRGLSARGKFSDELSFFCCPGFVQLPTTVSTSVSATSTTTALTTNTLAASETNGGKCSKKSDCPVNMCCSEHGYCGSSADYCNAKQKL